MRLILKSIGLMLAAEGLAVTLLPQGYLKSLRKSIPLFNRKSIKKLEKRRQLSRTIGAAELLGGTALVMKALNKR